MTVTKKGFKCGIIMVVILSIIMAKSRVTLADYYIQSWHLVDSGKHLDYDGNSKYMGNITVGVGKWEAYKKGVIRKDSLTVIQDVYVSDADRSDGMIAVTSSRGTIKFNPLLMAEVDSVYRSRVATHELGHALGLDHSLSSDMMYEGYIKTSYLSANDKESYDYMYDNRY